MKVDNRILKVMAKLPRLDCKHCGYPTCAELARVIVEGKAKISDCWILQQKQNVIIKIEDEKIPLSPFIQDIIRNTVLGMLRSLKHVKVKGDEYLFITVRKRRKGATLVEE